MRICSKCGESKPLTTEYYSLRKKTGKFEAACRECYNLHQKAHRLANIEDNKAMLKRYRNKSAAKIRSAYLKRTYNIEAEDIIKILDSQKGCCAICKCSLDNYCVDHNHTTGKVRGLLCSNCNTAIGLLQEDNSNLIAAIEYLEKHKDDDS